MVLLQTNILVIMRLVSKILFFLVGLSIVSCNQTSVEEDMAEYCDCIKANNGEVGERCKIVLDEMIIKYDLSS